MRLRRLPLQDNLSVVVSAAEEFQPATYHLVNAQYSLPFIARPQFDATVQRLRGAVRSGGVMAATDAVLSDRCAGPSFV
jgi:hypothetical protein